MRGETKDNQIITYIVPNSSYATLMKLVCKKRHY